MRNFRPVLGRDEDGGEADREVAPLQSLPTWPPPALDTEREGSEAALTLEVNTQTLKALTLLHHGEESLPPQPGTALAGVGYEVVGGRPGLPNLPVAAGSEADAEAEDEDDEETNGHQQPENCSPRQFGLNLDIRIIIKSFCLIFMYF